MVTLGSLVAPDPATQDCLPVNKSCKGPNCPLQRCIVDGPPHSWDHETRRTLANSILTEYGNSHDAWSSFLSNLDAVLTLRPVPDVSGLPNTPPPTSTSKSTSHPKPNRNTTQDLASSATPTCFTCVIMVVGLSRMTQTG